MTAHIDLLKVAAEQGVELWTENGRLGYQTRKSLSDDLRKTLKLYRYEIISALERLKLEIGREWISTNRAELIANGFTDRDMNNHSLPIGILYAVEWDRPGQTIEVRDGVIHITFTSLCGIKRHQTARPENNLREAIS